MDLRENYGDLFGYVTYPHVYQPLRRLFEKGLIYRVEGKGGLVYWAADGLDDGLETLWSKPSAKRKAKG